MDLPLDETAFPEMVAVLNYQSCAAFVVRHLRSVSASKDVDVELQPGAAKPVIYRHPVECREEEVILLRGVWMRPVGSWDGLHPAQIELRLDGETVLVENLEDHLMAGVYGLRRACACNGWVEGLSCRCPITPIINVSQEILGATAIDAENQADGKRQYGIFVANGTVLEIVLRKAWTDSARCRLRCGITAALYTSRR